MGLCPLHRESRPSFYVNACKNLFYCHGCGRGGDLIRFVELFLNLPFRQSVAHLQQELAPAAWCRSCWSKQLLFTNCNSIAIRKALRYLEQRGLHDPAPSKNWASATLPAETYGAIWLPSAIHSIWRSTSGLINHQGRDAFCRRVIFPCRQHGQIVNLYGRSIGTAFPHRLLPRSKGGLLPGTRSASSPP